MSDSQATTVVPIDEHDELSPTQVAIEDTEVGDAAPPTLSFEDLPKISILSIHMSKNETHDLAQLLATSGAPLAEDVEHGRIFLSAIGTARRAKFELQARGFRIHVPLPERGDEASEHVAIHAPSSKRVKVSETVFRSSMDTTATSASLHNIKVVRTDWLRDSVEAGKPLEFGLYLVYEASIEGSAPIASATPAISSPSTLSTLAEDPSISSQQRTTSRYSQREGRKDRNAAAAAKDFAGRSFMPSSQPAGQSTRQLLHETTTEHDEAINFPDPPEWVRQNKIYSCERAAPLHPPNEAFVGLLKKIRLARILVGDEIGVRAYSTSIASIISYPYQLSSGKEAMILPGCEQKVALLLGEFLDSGHVKAADEVDQDPVLSALDSFYNVWGVGATTAREFYYDRGWRDHDDLIEYGWSGLSRHQQIGLKYFDEFEQKMSRSEVEYIASVVTYHAKQLIDEELQCIIVGGYRRGKKESADVDVILTHPNEQGTKYLISPLVRALEKSGWITHTLIMSEMNSSRDQETLPLKSLESRKSGFDTLDKALVVWQDPGWRTREEDLAADPKAKNPNVHRRVDIIISPWKTVGCAVAGWTSGTTFQRDLRRYSRRQKGWKFDSSGVRDVGTGKWVDLEQWNSEQTRAKTWMEAEKRVFEGLGLPWIEPEDRNTG